MLSHDSLWTKQSSALLIKHKNRSDQIKSSLILYWGVKIVPRESSVIDVRAIRLLEKNEVHLIYVEQFTSSLM